MKLVKEHIEFQRGLDPRAAMRIGILTWDKLESGDILQNKKTVYPIQSKLFFSPNEDTTDDVRPNKYWIIKTIRSDKEWDGTPGLEIEMIWAGIFRHATSMAERIKQAQSILKTQVGVGPSYTANHSIVEWNEWFRIIQLNEYEEEYDR
jgi:hypothetical protein